MQRKSKWQLLTSAIALSCIFPGLGIELPLPQLNSLLNTNAAVYAKTTGGHSKGRSFKKSPSTSPPKRSSSPSNSSTTITTTTNYSSGGDTVIYPPWVQLTLFVGFGLLLLHDV